MIAEKYLVELHQEAVKENIYLKAKIDKLQSIIDLLKEYIIPTYSEESESFIFRSQGLWISGEPCKKICEALGCMDDWNEAMELKEIKK